MLWLYGLGVGLACLIGFILCYGDGSGIVINKRKLINFCILLAILLGLACVGSFFYERSLRHPIFWKPPLTKPIPAPEAEPSVTYDELEDIMG